MVTCSAGVWLGLILKRANVTILILVLIFCWGMRNNDAWADQNGQGPIDFEKVEWYAKRAAAAYESPEKIQTLFPNTTRVRTLDNNVRYFLEREREGQRQVLSIRGTANLANVREDAEFVPSKNAKLGIWVHKGFDEDSQAVFADVLPHLDRSRKVIVTGHSLGAAIATLMMMHLHVEGFEIGPSINFGQPKITNHHGVKRYQFLPLIRVVHKNDVVPLVPPIDLIDIVHGVYEHLGAETVLLEGEYYSFLDGHDAERASIGAFWRALGDVSIPAHYMKNYLRSIEAKKKGATRVSYSQRRHYYRVTPTSESAVSVDVSTIGER